MTLTIRQFSLLLATTIALASCSVASAHFPWIDVSDDGHALLYFGESPSERDYHLPESVANAKLVQIDGDGNHHPVEHQDHEADKFIGRKSTTTIDTDLPLTTSFQYGIYHGTLLTYYSRCQPLDALPTDELSGNQLDARLIKTDKGIDLQATWDGEPLAGASVTLIDGAGQQAQDTTNNRGEASFTSLAGGFVGFIVGHTVKEAGELDGDKYESQSHYLTVTTNYDSGSVSAENKSGSLPSLPAAIASFGAVKCDGYLYVYSGHTGRAHAHSRENLSPHFVRLNLDGGTKWEELPMEQPLQGLPLVTHGGKVYRVGGLDARNAPEEDDDLHSVATFAEYDPVASEWRELTPLPTPRSSHNAVVIGTKLYVAGGWHLSGDDSGDWQTDALVYDFANADAGWQTLPEPPFRRRALAVGEADGRLVVIGGIDDVGSISFESHIYDPATSKWSDGPALPGEGMAGFGLAAWAIDDKLHVGGLGGVVYRLADDLNQWQETGHIAAPRFFHQFSADDQGQLIVIAGATARDGHVTTLEVVDVAGQE